MWFSPVLLTRCKVVRIHPLELLDQDVGLKTAIVERIGQLPNPIVKRGGNRKNLDRKSVV